MATIKTNDEDVKLFVADDAYYFAVDNRPLRELLTNDQAINAQLEDVVESDCEVISVVVESPTVETSVGGPYSLRNAGACVRVAVSVGTPGAAGSFVVNMKIDGVTAFTTPANKPSLAYDDADSLVVVSAGSIENPLAGVNAKITFDVEAVQTGGTPRWLRVVAWFRKSQAGYDAGDY